MLLTEGDNQFSLCTKGLQKAMEKITQHKCFSVIMNTRQIIIDFFSPLNLSASAQVASLIKHNFRILFQVQCLL